MNVTGNTCFDNSEDQICSVFFMIAEALENQGANSVHLCLFFWTWNKTLHLFCFMIFLVFNIVHHSCDLFNSELLLRMAIPRYRIFLWMQTLASALCLFRKAVAMSENCLYFCCDKLFIKLEFILMELEPVSNGQINTVKSFSYPSFGHVTGQALLTQCPLWGLASAISVITGCIAVISKRLLSHLEILATTCFFAKGQIWTLVILPLPPA